MQKPEYVIQTDVKFGGLERISVGALVSACPHDWFNQTLCRVNESVVRLGVFKGEFHFHKHDREDEFFYVVSGRLFVELEGRVVELGPNEGVMVPHGVVHRTRAPQRTVVLMVEGDTVKPTGDS